MHDAALSIDSATGTLSNVPLLGAINMVGNRAAAAHDLRMVATTTWERQAARFLKDVGLADRHGVLLPESLGATTRIRDPCLVANLETAYGRRRQLLQSGWSLAQSGRQASCASRLLHPNQCKQYYLLLLDRLQSMQAQEEAGWLSHCQVAHYYITLLEAFAALYTA